MKIKTFILDSQPGLVQSLSELLETAVPSIKLAGFATNVKDAIQQIRNLQPDLVFMEIHLPPENGFDVLEATKDLHFEVVITTSFPQFTIPAINKANLAGYLVKPYSLDELQHTVSKIERKLSLQHKSAIVRTVPKGIIVNDARKGDIILMAEQILYCRADGGYTEFVYLDGNYKRHQVASGHLGIFEDKLPKDSFCRIHHSTLINLKFISSIERTGRNGIAHLWRDIKLNISVAKMEPLKKMIEQYLGYNN